MSDPTPGAGIPASAARSIRERERAEAAPYVEQAKREGRAITFIASDGCAVTAMPDGSTLFNATDWF